jgi:hypothetical protein
MRVRLLPIVAVAGLALALATCSPMDTSHSTRERDETDGPKKPTPAVIEDPSRPANNDVFRKRLELAIKNVRDRKLQTTHGFWTVFHAILGLGPKDAMLKDPADGKTYNAFQYVCDGGRVPGMEFVPTADGLDVASAATPDQFYMYQGHQDQFVAEMAQWGTPLDQPFTVRGKKYTFEAFVKNSERRANLKTNQELSWTILIMAQYRGTSYEWKNDRGETLRLEDLLDYELKAKMETAACGGTHRLFDLAWVHHLHLKRGGKEEGIWKRVAENTAKHQALARKLRNADFSFSTEFFKGRGADPDRSKRINTSGHIFEWLSLSLSDKQLREPWVEDAANALAVMILELGTDALEGATLYHAVHGLILYHARLFEPERLARDYPWLPLPPPQPS